MKSFYNCSLFENENFEITDSFVVKQEELLFKSSLSNNNISFSKILVDYECKWIEQKNWNNEKPTIIIPIKDNILLLEKTCLNLKKYQVNEICNVIIVDDRSSDTIGIKELSIKNDFSYLRVENKKGFNFSMLNNIAAFICYKLGIKHIILWNSDLWCAKTEFLTNILSKHIENNSVISGTKLVYPPIEMSMNKQEDSENISFHFPNMKGKWRKTIQFGGGFWIDTTKTSLIAFSPMHYRRFKQLDDLLANVDKTDSFVTGAFQIIDLNWFIKIGGLNPSLSKNFQDVDLCLRALEEKSKVFYFGKDIYFYHDESVSLIKEGKNDVQLYSDHALFAKIWNNKLLSLVL